MHYGKPTKEQKEAYTRVLIGSIELASLVFPAELRTDQLDALARGPLWSVGADYQHGTGHGVGHFLSVHERKKLFLRIMYILVMRRIFFRINCQSIQW